MLTQNRIITRIYSVSQKCFGNNLVRKFTMKLFSLFYTFYSIPWGGHVPKGLLRSPVIVTVLYMREKVISYYELSYLFWKKMAAIQKSACVRLWMCFVRFSQENESTV